MLNNFVSFVTFKHTDVRLNKSGIGTQARF